MYLKYHKKLKYLLTPLLIVSLIFILYQLIIFSQLSSLNEKKKINKVLGTHEYQASFYVSKDDKFHCIVSLEVIDYSMVNDDYCDCQDGSDEPGTNACSNGSFFCTSQTSIVGFKKLISSNRVNDGICDCCDGSDEYMYKPLGFRLSDEIQKKIGKYMTPCPNFCAV